MKKQLQSGTGSILGWARVKPMQFHWTDKQRKEIFSGTERPVWNELSLEWIDLMPKKQLGKLPPRYRFALNQYAATRWSKCPRCSRLTYVRKFPLLIHIDGYGLLTLGKTCRYCPKCEFIIAHQDDLEHITTEIFSESHPEVVGNQYLVIGTVETKVWREGMIEPLKIEEILEHTSDIKDHLVLHYEQRGWTAPDQKNLERIGMHTKGQSLK